MRTELGNGDLSRSSSSEMGDYIGMESGLDLNNQNNDLMISENFDQTVEDRHWYSLCKRDQRWMMTRREKKVYPPPMPLLARVMRRYHTCDGRLIIREERVDRCEYFRAHRSDGRLTLQLVLLNDVVLDGDNVDVASEDDDDGNGKDGGDEVGSGEMEEDQTVVVGGGGKCYKYECAKIELSYIFTPASLFL